MAAISKLQASFSAGEIAPDLRGRVDIEKYSSSCRTLLNYLVSPFGAVYHRPGLRYVKSLADQTAIARLISFQYSNTQAYILEFSNLKLRFYKDQGNILQGRGITNGAFAAGVTGWADTSSGTGTRSYDGTNHRMNLNSTGVGDEGRATATVLTNYGVAQYTVTLDVGTNTITYKVGTTSAASDIATGTLTAGTGKTFTFTPTTNGSVFITLQAAANAYVDNVVLSTPSYTIDTPFTTADLPNLRVTESFDTLYICNGRSAPYKLVRLGHDEWTMSVIQFSEPPYQDSNATSVTLTPSGVTGSVTFTASSATFVSTDVGRAIRYKAGVDSSKTVQYPGTGTQVNFDIPFFPQMSTDVEVSFIEATGARTAKTYNASPSAGQFTVTSGQVVTGDTATTSQRVEIRQAGAGSGTWGWAIITAYTSTTQVTATIYSTLSGTNASVYWRLGAWSDTTGYPAVCTFHEQRLWFASTSTQPQTLWGSTTGDFENFSPDNVNMQGQVDSDTALNFPLNTPAIQWIKGLKAMVVGCSDGIIQISNPNGAISAAANQTKKDASIKCEFSEITATSDEILFFELLGKKMHSLKFSFQVDGFVPNDLTTLSKHMPGSSSFTNLAYADTPSRIVWVMRADGQLRSCTYVPDQNLIGWAQHTVGGTGVTVESIACISGATYSELWAIVKRTINGSTTRYVEVMQAEFNAVDADYSVFSDGSLTYTGSPTTTITGLGHLEGESVTVIVDGATHPNKTVSGGSITLNYSGSIVQVGLYSHAVLESQFIEGGNQLGTSQANISALSSVVIRFHETIGGNIGYDASELEPIPFRQPSDDMNSSVALFSGDKQIIFSHGYDSGYKVYVEQPYALPSTILMLVYSAKVSSNY